MTQTAKQSEILIEDVEPKGDILPSKTTINPIKMTTKQIAYIAMRERGLNQCQAVKESGISKGYGSMIDAKMNNKYDLVESKMLSAAHKAHKKILAGKSWGDVKDIKASDVNRCIDRVYDRSQPVVKHNVNLNANINFVEVNLNEFK